MDRLRLTFYLVSQPKLLPPKFIAVLRPAVNHDAEQCGCAHGWVQPCCVKWPHFSSANLYNQTTTQNLNICQSRKEAIF